MSVKSRNRRRVFWGILIFIALIVTGLLVLPSFMNLNKMRERIQDAIYAQTGVVTDIRGDITFGILGRVTIVNHEVYTEHGDTRKLAIKIPLSGLFDPFQTDLSGEITATGADISLTTLETLNLKYDMIVHDSVIRFMGKPYYIIDGLFKNGTFNGLVRTGDHKYDIRFNDKEFTIKNKNVNLNINGELYPSGAASGTMEISTTQLNSWFEFDEPKLTRKINLSTNFWWDGGYGFRFHNLTANNVHGSIDLDANGWRTFILTSDNTDFDFSFLAHPSDIVKDSRIDIDFYGNLKFEKRKFNHVKIDAVGTEDYLQITKAIADDTVFTGGTIDKDGAHEVMIKSNIDGTPFQCLFSGWFEKWECEKFTYANLSGSLRVNKDSVVADIVSNSPMTIADIESYLFHFGKKNAYIKFKFANMGGRFTLSKKGASVEYDYVYGKTLRWLNPHIKLLPDFMKDEIGNIIWTDNAMSFIPNSNEWSLTLQGNSFYMTGNNIKKWAPHLDMRAINDFAYVATGSYNSRGDISDLVVKVGGHVFTGTANSTSITLHTDNLVLDTFINSEFFDRYEEMEFLANAPIMVPFEFNHNIYLTANTLTFDKNTFRNFVYALKSGTQTFSITDRARGNLLATIIRERSEYDIFVQLNKFVINGKLMTQSFPLNISDTSITAEMQLKTSGRIAHDIWYNMTGDVDITFDGGYLNGIGLDEFYANAANLTRLNVEDYLRAALESGTTKMKTMRVVGKYDHGNFSATRPLTITVRHADIVGALNIHDNLMDATFDISMRATAPDPVTVTMTITQTGERSYSMGEIIRYFDPPFMREFIKTHTKF